MPLGCRSCGSLLPEPVLEKASPADFSRLKRFLGSFTGAGLEKQELAHLFVLRDVGNGKKIVGTVELLPCGAGTFYLCRVKVARHLRRQGIGRKLFRHALARARTSGAWDVFAVTRSREDAPAVKIARQLGASEIRKDELQERVVEPMIGRYSIQGNRFWRFPVNRAGS